MFWILEDGDRVAGISIHLLPDLNQSHSQNPEQLNQESSREWVRVSVSEHVCGWESRQCAAVSKNLSTCRVSGSRGQNLQVERHICSAHHFWLHRVGAAVAVDQLRSHKLLGLRKKAWEEWAPETVQQEQAHPRFKVTGEGRRWWQDRWVRSPLPFSTSGTPSWWATERKANSIPAYIKIRDQR